MDNPFESSTPDPLGEKPGDNMPELTVSELSNQLKRTIEDQYSFVRVRGELGRVVAAKSGHLYFDIKDANATLNSVMWKGQAGRLPFKPEEGLEVVAEGKLSTYPGRSNYQLIADRMRPAGLGALMQLLDERRKKLAAEGLFDPARKKPIPYLPAVIGVVTSPTGAVIRDIIHRVRDRFPVHVIIWPSLVQGPQAADQVEAGIRGFNALAPGGPIPRPDLIIVARGGGSIEDLWPFNEERVVRAAADSVIPLISAVGHETDTTLIDHAADRRAPTPTAAAEIALPVRADLIAQVAELGSRSARRLTQSLAQRRQHLRSTSARLPRLDALLQSPRQRLDLAAQRFGGALAKAISRKRARFEARAGRLQPSTLRRELGLKQQALGRSGARLAPALSRNRAQHQRNLDALVSRLAKAAPNRRVDAARRTLDQLAERLRPAARRSVEQARRRFDAQARILETLSYERILNRGFALVTRADGALVRSTKLLREGDPLRLRFADGETLATVGKSKPPAKPKAAPVPEEPAPDPEKHRPRIRRVKRDNDDDTGSLF